jgi:cell wall-associated NlpC family hydrolase
MVNKALRWMGTPYEYGGTGQYGIDCSSLVQHAFADCNYRLPRTAAEQFEVGEPVDTDHLQPGDRLYFSASGSRIDHTGLYIGNGLFVEASGHFGHVVVSSLYEARCWNIYKGARR